MTQRILNSKGPLAYLAAAATWLTLYLKAPFPEENLFLRLFALRTPFIFQGLKCSYPLFLFTTPYIVYSILLSGVYVFALRVRRRISPGRLPAYPNPRKRNEVFLVLGEVHNPRKPLPSESRNGWSFLSGAYSPGLPSPGLSGTGKTSCCMYPFAEQLLAYQAHDKEKNCGPHSGSQRAIGTTATTHRDRGEGAAKPCNSEHAPPGAT